MKKNTLNKRFLFLLALLAISFGGQARLLYWVDGSGSWNESSHWSIVSGGQGGAGIPGMNDDIFFDRNSFHNPGETITIQGAAVCQSMNWSADVYYPVLVGNPSSSLDIYGSLNLTEDLGWQFDGTIYFKATAQGNVINTNGKTFPGNIYFDGTGSWKLQNSYLILSPSSTLTLASGTLQANGNAIQCGTLKITGAGHKFLDINNSKLFIKNQVDSASASNFTCSSLNSSIYYKNYSGINNFGNLGNPQSHRPSYVASFKDSIILPSCNCQDTSKTDGVASCCNGRIKIYDLSASEGGRPFKFQLNNGAEQSDSVFTNLCETLGAFTITIYDTSDISQTGFVGNLTVSNISILGESPQEPSCHGDCNGEIIISSGISGGTPNYTYLWSAGKPAGNQVVGASTSFVDSGLCVVDPSSKYYIIIKDANKCKDSISYSLGQPKAITATTTVVDEVQCNGQSNGSATATASGGHNAPYTYTWEPGGSTNRSVTGLSFGTYTVTAEDGSGCTGSATVTITQPNPLSISFSPVVEVSCNGSSTGSATATVTGGTTAYSYSWSNGKTTSAITALSAGTYTLNVTDANGCTATNTVTITQPSTPLTVHLSAAPNPLACYGNKNSTISSVVGGGVATYTYSWLPGGQTTTDITGQGAGTYTLTVTDANGCTATNTITISQPAQLRDSIASQTNIICNGSLGSAKVGVIGGSTPYSYNWLPSGGTSATATGLTVGSYTVTVTDNNGCTNTAVATITQLAPLTLIIAGVGDECNGYSDGIASVTASGGTKPYTYAWAPSGGTKDSAINLSAACYTVTVTDVNGCKTTADTCITEPLALSMNLSSINTSCTVCNGSASVSVSGGTLPYSYNWAPVGQTKDTAKGLCTDTYTITVTDAHGCTISKTVDIIPTVHITLTTNGDSVTCFNECDGIASANPSGGTSPYSYKWIPGGQTTPSVTGLCPGSYTVNVQDANGCTATDSAKIGNPAQLKPSTTQNNIACFGGTPDGSATATATGGTGAYTYSWAPGGQTTSSITGLSVGSYTVTVTDSKGCDSAVVVNITSGGTINPNPSIVEPLCGINDGSITLSVTGGSSPYTYLWAPGGQTTSAITGLSAGTYTITITDHAGCIQTALIPLSNSSGPTVVATSTSVTCAGTCNGSCTVTVTAGSGPFNYLWGNGNTTTSISALCAGVYACNITDKNGCVKSITDTVKDPVPISPTPTVQNILCNTPPPTGSISFSPTGGTGPYTYSWSPNVSTSSSASSLSAGTYTITITDHVGCDTVTDITISEPATFTVTITSTNISCNGDNNGSATAHPSGGTSPYSYSWQPGGAITPTDVNLSQGTYTVTTTDKNGCKATATVTITEPNPLIVVTKPIEVSCNSGTNGGASTTVTGGTSGFNYSWSNGQTADSLKNVASGTYFLTVTDANGCTYTTQVTISQPTAINIPITPVNILCNGDCNGTATATISGGISPYNYSWSTVPPQTNLAATGLCAGTYTITVSDANGCPADNSITISQPNALDANPSATSTTCPNSCDGTAKSTPLGGIGPYTYKWMPGGQVTPSINNLCSGTYTVVVQDANNCSDKETIFVPSPFPLTPNISTSAGNCNISNGSITLAPSGGTGPYSFVWTPPVSTSNSAAGLSAGVYTVQITDTKGCDTTSLILLNNTGGITDFSNALLNEPCFGESVGYIDVSPVGGAMPYTYLWVTSPVPQGQGTDSIYSIPADTYTAQVTDANGCVQFDTATITQPAALSNQVNTINAGCIGVCTGSISLTTSGGTPPYTYDWSNNQTTSSITGLCVGSYTDTLKDNNGCTLIQTFVVGANVVISVDTSMVDLLCYGYSNGSASATATGGGGIFNYIWAPGGQTNQTATNLSAGTYTVTITDQNGCQGIDSVTITQPPQITIDMVVTPDSCNNACDGKIVAQVNGGIPPYLYSWTPPNDFIDSIMNLCSGTYTVNIEDVNGCIQSDSVTLINPPVFSESNSLIQPICNNTADGEITIIPAGGIAPFQYAWMPNVSTGTTANNLREGTYTITIIDSTGCTLKDIIPLIADTTVLANTGNDTGVCVGDSVILNGSKSTPVSPIITYQWFQLPGPIPIGNTPIDTIPPPNTNTTYELVTQEGSCTDTSEVTYTINPLPAVNAGPTQSIVIYSSVTIGGSPTGPPGSSYIWMPPLGLNDTTIQNPVASPTSSTTYTVIVTNTFGCSASDTVTIFVIPEIVPYGGFTPNGDGVNDVWNIKNISDFPNAVVEIFNRWGEELFYSQGYKKPWDGTYNNEPVPIGTYYYIINLHDPRFPKPSTGSVTIQR